MEGIFGSEKAPCAAGKRSVTALFLSITVRCNEKTAALNYPTVAS